MSTNRVIIFFLLALITLAIIFILPEWIFILVVMALVGMGLNEFFTLIRKKEILIYKYFGIVIGMLIPLTMYFEFEPTRGWELFFIVSACLGLFVLQFIRRESSQAIIGISTTLFGIFYVSWFLSFLIKLRHLSGGTALVTFLLLVAKSGDAGAYLVGVNFGRHNLIPRISPKKSVEGAIGGLVFSLAAAVGSKIFLPQIPYLHLVILGCLLGILAQIGDLSESLIKRDCQVRDSGSFIPGLGGVLDLIDSILFTAPIFYFYVKFLL